MPPVPGPSWHVERRYSDFESLREALLARAPPGFASLPSLPPKHVLTLGRADPSKRTAGLERFLKAALALAQTSSLSNSSGSLGPGTGTDAPPPRAWPQLLAAFLGALDPSDPSEASGGSGGGSGGGTGAPAVLQQQQHQQQQAPPQTFSWGRRSSLGVDFAGDGRGSTCGGTSGPCVIKILPVQTQLAMKTQGCDALSFDAHLFGRFLVRLLALLISAWPLPSTTAHASSYRHSLHFFAVAFRGVVVRRPRALCPSPFQVLGRLRQVRAV